MMGLYLYCIGPPDHPAPEEIEGIEGIDSAPVRALDLDGLRGWISPLAAAPAASLDRVRRHNAVVEASARARTPLPMRFGQWFASEAELLESIAERRPGLERALERVRGAMEYGVRVMDPDRPSPATPDRSSGKAYLEGLARREEAVEVARRRGAEVAAELRSFLGPLVRAQEVRQGGSGALVAIAHLVARHDTGTYTTRLRTFSSGRPELRFVFSGPWPPYGFTDDRS